MRHLVGKVRSLIAFRYGLKSHQTCTVGPAEALTRYDLLRRCNVVMCRFNCHSCLGLLFLPTLSIQLLSYTNPWQQCMTRRRLLAHTTSTSH